MQQDPRKESAFWFCFSFPDRHQLELGEGSFELNAIGAF
jgi:hypothetical protein